MERNVNFKQWFNVFLILSEAWQGYESKAYGVSNHHLKLQSKKFSRTRDIPNFPTQGCVGTAFYASKWSETYIFQQECIPVGCILPAAVAAWGVSIRHPPGSRPPQTWHPLPEQTPPRTRPPCKACWDTTCNACWDSTPLQGMLGYHLQCMLG